MSATRCVLKTPSCSSENSSEVINLERRIGVVAISVLHKESAMAVNSVLHEFAEIIRGRMGIPLKEKNLAVISILVDGTTDEIGALTGRLGQIEGVKVKSLLVKV